MPLRAAGHLVAQEPPHRLAGRGAAGGDHRLMQATMVDVHITGVVQVHHLGLMPGNALFDLFDQI